MGTSPYAQKLQRNLPNQAAFRLESNAVVEACDYKASPLYASQISNFEQGSENRLDVLWLMRGLQTCLWNV